MFIANNILLLSLHALKLLVTTGPAALLLHEVCGSGAGACINCIPTFSTSIDDSIFNLCLLNAVYKTSTSHLPVVRLESLHPVVHEQELGALQVPPFGQDVDPKHIAETDYIAASSICVYVRITRYISVLF